MNFIQENLTSVKRSENSKNDAITSKNQILGKPIMAPPASKSSDLKTPSSARNKPTLGSDVLKSGSSRMVNNSQVIVALCEGRGQARGIVGIAAIDVNKPVLVLCQISDTQTYTNTLTKINILRPVEVLIPSSFVECTTPSRITTLLKDQFPNLTVSSVSRSAFRSSRGLSYVTNLCAPQFISVNLVIRQKFYALASASALITYIQKEQHVIYPDNSIKVEYQEPEDTAVIDIDSADRLELVSCCNHEARPINLLSMLDHCVTGVGRKMLRATILQPPCVDDVIHARLDCVQELRDSAEFRIKLKAVLTNLHNIECALLFGTMVPQSAAAVSDKQLNYTLQLKMLLTNIEPLRNALEEAHHPLFRNIHEHLVHAPYSRLLNKLHKVLNEEAHPASGHAGDLQRCFAIRTGLNGFLDIARRTYMEVIDDMRAYVENLGDKYGLPLRIHHTQKRGFHIVLNLTGFIRHMEKASLPSVFVKVERNTTHFSMTTSDMTSFGVRLQTNCQEIESISNVIIYQLMSNIKQCIGHLYQLCDDVALLDVLHSLATVSTASGYIRPKFSTEYMEIIAARHPLLEHSSTQEPVPNNIVASDLYNLHIVTGPNMSGKSIYVRQIPLLQVLAQIGCYVPARSAVLRSCTHMYARISVEDNLHDNSSTTTSTFVREMTEIQYLLNTVGTGSRSLIILDELCHSTSVDEGVSIAYAICEQLLMTKSYIFVATHYLTMTKLANLYYNVKNAHLEAIEILRNNRKSLKFTHRLIAGVNGVETYGIKLSRICGGSDIVSDRAEQILHDLLPTNKIILPTESTSHLKFRLYADLKLLQQQNKLTLEAEKNLLDKYEELTGIHYEIGQVLSEDKVPSRTSSTRGSGKTSTSTATASSKSTVQSRQYCKSSTSVYDVARHTPRASDKSSSKSDYLSKVVDQLIPSEEDFLHCITAEENGDPLGVSVKQTDAQSDDSSDFEIAKDKQDDYTSVIVIDSPTYSPNFDTCTERYSPPFVCYTPDSLPAGLQLPIESPLSPSPASDDLERKSQTAQPSEIRLYTSLSYDPESSNSSYSEPVNLTINRSKRDYSNSEDSSYSEPLNQVIKRSEKNCSTSEVFDLNQPKSDPIDLNHTRSNPIDLNHGKSNPIDLNQPTSNPIDLNQPKLNPIDLKEPASKPLELNYLNSNLSEIICLDSPSRDPKTSNCPAYESSSPETSSPETISFDADISDGGTVKKADHLTNSNDITFEYNKEMEVRLAKKNVTYNEQRESVTISTYYSVSSNYRVTDSGSVGHTVQETRYSSYHEITPNNLGSRSSTSRHSNTKQQNYKHNMYPSTSGYISYVRSSREPSRTTLQDTNTKPNVYPSTSEIPSESRMPPKQPVSTVQDSFGARFQEQNQFSNISDNSPFIFNPVLPARKQFFSAVKEHASSANKPIFGNSSSTIPQESDFNTVPLFTSTAKPSLLPLWSKKVEHPKENTFKCNLKPAASDYKSETFPETLGSTSRKPVTQRALTKPYIPQRINRQNQTQKSSQEVNTIYDYFMADFEANQKKIQDVLRDEDDDEFIYGSEFDRQVKQNENKPGKRLQPQNTELSEMTQGKTSCQETKLGTCVADEKKNIMPDKAVNTWDDFRLRKQPKTRYNESAITNRADTKSNIDQNFIANETIRSLESEGTFANYFSAGHGATSTPSARNIHAKGNVTQTAKQRAAPRPESRVKILVSSSDDTRSSDNSSGDGTSSSEYMPCTRSHEFTQKISGISYNKSYVDLARKKSSVYSPVPRKITGSNKKRPTKTGSSTVTTSGKKPNNKTASRLQLQQQQQQQALEVSNKQVVVDETQFYTGSSQSFTNKNTNASDMSSASKGKPKSSNRVEDISKPIARSATASCVQSEQQQQQQQQPNKKPSKVTRKPRGKTKKTRDDKASEDLAYKKLEAHIMAPIRSKRQREMDKFFDDVKRMRTNMETSTEQPDSEYANIQYCPSKKQMSKLEYVAVGQRKTTGEMNVQMNTPKPALKTSPTTDCLILKYLGKEALEEYQNNPSK